MPRPPQHRALLQGTTQHRGQRQRPPQPQGVVEGVTAPRLQLGFEANLSGRKGPSSLVTGNHQEIQSTCKREIAALQQTTWIWVAARRCTTRIWSKRVHMSGSDPFALHCTALHCIAWDGMGWDGSMVFPPYPTAPHPTRTHKPHHTTSHTTPHPAAWRQREGRPSATCAQHTTHSAHLDTQPSQLAFSRVQDHPCHCLLVTAPSAHHTTPH